MGIRDTAAFKCRINVVQYSLHCLYRGDTSIHNRVPAPLNISADDCGDSICGRHVILKRKPGMIGFGRFHQTHDICDAGVDQPLGFCGG